MDVSVIIVNYHSSKLVEECINSIFDKTRELTYEIIVVDNDSQDGSVEYLQAQFGDKIKVIDADTNLGFGKANNLGASYASGEYLFLLNPDTLLVNNAMKILIDYMEDHPEAGVAGGNLYGPEMNPAGSFCLAFDTLEEERKKASWFAILGNKITDKLGGKDADIRKVISRTFNESGQPMEVAYVFGADMMMKASLFRKVGGFDPDFFMYAEEEELSWRIRQSGKKSVSVPQAKIIHLEGMTTVENGEFREKQFRMRMNGNMTYYLKRDGQDGVKCFFRYRARRYGHLITIARLRGKNLTSFTPALQKKCLTEEYQKFIKRFGE